MLVVGVVDSEVGVATIVVDADAVGTGDDGIGGGTPALDFEVSFVALSPEVAAATMASIVDAGEVAAPMAPSLLSAICEFDFFFLRCVPALLPSVVVFVGDELSSLSTSTDAERLRVVVVLAAFSSCCSSSRAALISLVVAADMLAVLCMLRRLTRVCDGVATVGDDVPLPLPDASGVVAITPALRRTSAS